MVGFVCASLRKLQKLEPAKQDSRITIQYVWIAGLHVTSGRLCWEPQLYFHVNSSRKNYILLTPNVAALTRGCIPRIEK